jgi:hypothetical protein
MPISSTFPGVDDSVKASNFKPQASGKPQTQSKNSLRDRRYPVRNSKENPADAKPLEFGIWCFSGAWSLMLGAFPRHV